MTEIPQKEKKVEVITANSNPRIKELNKLNKDAKLRKDRDVFVVEGIRMFRELPLQNVQEVYLSESALKEYRDEFKSMGVACWFCSTAEGQYTYWTVTFN